MSETCPVCPRSPPNWRTAATTAGPNAANPAAMQTNSGGNLPRLLLGKSLWFMLSRRINLGSPTANKAGARWGTTTQRRAQARDGGEDARSQSAYDGRYAPPQLLPP